MKLLKMLALEFRPPKSLAKRKSLAGLQELGATLKELTVKAMRYELPRAH